MANNKKTDKPAKPAAPKGDKPAAKADKGEKAEKGEKTEKSAAKPAAKGGAGKGGAKGGERKPADKKAEKAEAEAKVAAPVEAAPAAPGKSEAAPAPSAAVVAGRRRKLVGRVTSNKMNKTVTVEVVRDAPDPVYKKYVRQRERYKAHDETNQYKVGDRVEITEHRPLSRDKRWLVTRLVSRPVEE